jgi:hypothetical protein
MDGGKIVSKYIFQIGFVKVGGVCSYLTVGGKGGGASPSFHPIKK